MTPNIAIQSVFIDETSSVILTSPFGSISAATTQNTTKPASGSHTPMAPSAESTLVFDVKEIVARFLLPDGQSINRTIEVRTNPVTGRTSRISYSRIHEKEAGTDTLPAPPPNSRNTAECPFCRPNVFSRTPALHPHIDSRQRIEKGRSVLFPNLYPYGQYSAVSLIDDNHFVEIGRASASSYTDSLLNCRNYLTGVVGADPAAVYWAVTQNHLPSAGGSLLHPHLQVNADSIAPNHHRFLLRRSARHFEMTGNRLFTAYLNAERRSQVRYIARVGDWHWMAAFAPEGFFEIWGILPGVTSMQAVTESQWRQLAESICCGQRFFRKLNRNGYNLGLISSENADSHLEVRAVLMVRSNYAPWVRNDHTGYEVMLGDMTTFEPPEKTAEAARPFFRQKNAKGGVRA